MCLYILKDPKFIRNLWWLKRQDNCGCDVLKMHYVFFLVPWSILMWHDPQYCTGKNLGIFLEFLGGADQLEQSGATVDWLVSQHIFKCHSSNWWADWSQRLFEFTISMSSCLKDLTAYFRVESLQDGICDSPWILDLFDIWSYVSGTEQ